MTITVSITTCNRAESLARGLEALASQDFDFENFDVIVADNGIPDETKQVCDAYAKRFSRFQYLNDQRPGQLIGWHRSLALAEGDVTCFIDDDAEPELTWLAGLAEGYADPAVGMVTGPIRARYETEAPDWADEMTLGEPGSETLPALGLLDCGDSVRDIPGNFVWGTNFTVRRNLLIEAGGFHPGAMPGHLLRFYGDGEIAVGRAVEIMGHRIVYHPMAAVRHVIPAFRFSDQALHAKFYTAGCARSFQYLRRARQAFEIPTEDEIREVAARYFRRGTEAPAELLGVVMAGLKHGLSDHVAAFDTDPAFQAWVLWENYLDLEQCYVHPDLVGVEAGQSAECGTDWRAGVKGG